VCQRGTKRIATSEWRIDFGAARIERSVDALTTRQRIEDILTTDEIAGRELFVALRTARSAAPSLPRYRDAARRSFNNHRAIR
jgi:hypothetical protein